MDYLFERMGFSSRWCTWMRACIEDTSYSILVNGSPTNPIHANRRLRQGDPLSSFIFTLVAESMNKLVEKARELDIVKGFKVEPDSPIMTHLQFIDDTLFLCDPARQELLGFKAILRCFELVSGLGINLGKSSLIGIGLDDFCIRELAEDFGCGSGKLPFTYLGLPVGGNPRLKRFWTPIVEKMEKRLVGWARNIYLWVVGSHLSKQFFLICQHTTSPCFNSLRASKRNSSNSSGIFFGEAMRQKGRFIWWLGLK